MLKTVLSVVGGLIAGSLCVWLMESLGHYLYPLPKGMKPNDMETFKQYVSGLPFMGLFIILIGYALSACVSGFAATKIANNGKQTSAIICGIILLSFTVYNMIVLPTPIWFWILGISVWGLVLLGYKLASNKKQI